MLRFISFLLFLAGIVAAWLGASVLSGNTQWLPNIGGEPTVEVSAPEGWTVEVAPEVIETPEPVTATSPPPSPPPPPSPAPVTAAPPPPAAVRTAPTPSTARTVKNTKDNPPAMAEPSKPMAMEAEPIIAQPQAMESPRPAPVESVNDVQMRDIKSVQELFEDSLRTVPVAHQAPETAAYKRSFNVTLALDATGDSTAKDALSGDGRIVEGTAKVSNTVKAELTGAKFDIEGNSPAVQSLSPVTENVWRWSVTPLEAGKHSLTFDLFAIDGDLATPLRTYSDDVAVEVSGISRAIAFADQANPIAVFLGGVGSMIAGLFGVFRFFRRKT